jgi:ABC-type hemin transport system ATPase subunit
MSAEDVRLVRKVLRVHDGSEFEANDFPTLQDGQEASAALARLTARWQEAERERNEKIAEAAEAFDLAHDMDARVQAAEAREAALREALRMISGNKPEYEMRSDRVIAAAALAADPESEEAPE